MTAWKSTAASNTRAGEMEVILKPFQARLTPARVEEILSHPVISSPPHAAEQPEVSHYGSAMQTMFRAVQLMSLAAIKFSTDDEIATPQQRQQAAQLLLEMKM